MSFVVTKRDHKRILRFNDPSPHKMEEDKTTEDSVTSVA